MNSLDHRRVLHDCCSGVVQCQATQFVDTFIARGYVVVSRNRNTVSDTKIAGVEDTNTTYMHSFKGNEGRVVVDLAATFDQDGAVSLIANAGT